MAKEIKTRIVLKHDIEANWNKAITFIPKKNEFIFYDPDANYNFYRVKCGDGTTLLNNLNFIMWDSADVANGAVSAKNYLTGGTIETGLSTANDNATQAIEMVQDVIDGGTAVGVAKTAQSVAWDNVTGNKPNQVSFSFENGVLTINC